MTANNVEIVGDSQIPSVPPKSKALQLSEIRNAIPKEAFQKSFSKSMFYLIFDYVMWFGSTYAIFTFRHSAFWNVLPFWQQAIASIVYWNVSGFFMWCLFVVGHDCGHGTFSENQLVNDVIGHVAHGTLLVPYYPWQMSHHRHHMYHNHVDKDYSHPWYTEEKLNHPNAGMTRLMHTNVFLKALFPVYGWPVYLYGFPDGSHWIPFSQDRLWKESDPTDGWKAIPSTLSCVFFFSLALMLCNYSWLDLIYYYLVPVVVFGWWLVTVTYLQHHSPETVVYDDKDWNFVESAFETVDRRFGFGIDALHHHITDCHVVHHLFFTRIPHYNLPQASRAVQTYLKEKGFGNLYKFESTLDFPYRVHSYIYNHGLRAILARDKNKKQE